MDCVPWQGGLLLRGCLVRSISNCVQVSSDVLTAKGKDYRRWILHLDCHAWYHQQIVEGLLLDHSKPLNLDNGVAEKHGEPPVLSKVSPSLWWE